VDQRVNASRERKETARSRNREDWSARVSWHPIDDQRDAFGEMLEAP
jgi:hypothetical protein